MTHPRPRAAGGRQTQAARNDERILTAARAVFVADPDAPIAAVAARAGVGISALYRRYPSKEELLRTLCGDGLATYLGLVEAALADQGDPWQAFVRFVRGVVDADTSALTISLAGTFTPTEQLNQAAQRADELNQRLIDRTRAAGAIRPDLGGADLGLIFEQLSSIRLGDGRRTAELRHRYVALVLDALRMPDAPPLPGPAPTPEEMAGRWWPGPDGA